MPTIVVPHIRAAQVEDMDQLMNMCREMHSENGVFTMNEVKVHDTLQRALNRRGAIVGVIDNDKELEASIYLMVATHWYSDQMHLNELWNYVRPTYRRTDNAKKLISFAKRCSNESGLPLVIGVVSNTRTEAKVRLYERQLSKPAGAWFFHQPMRGAA